MVSVLLAALCVSQNGFEGKLDALAGAKNTTVLTSYLGPGVPESDLDFLKRPGVYGIGRYGWNVEVATMPSGQVLAVFHTKMTTQGIGDQVFVVQDSKLVRRIPEEDAFGHRLVREDLEVWFNRPAKKAKIKAEIQMKRESGSADTVLVRISDHYRVSSVVNAAGQDVAFAQAGGVVGLDVGDDSESSLTLTYEGVVNGPGFSGTVGMDEAQLTNDYWWPMLARQPIPFSVDIHTPLHWKAVANGALVSNEAVGTEREFRYEMDVPICYLSLSAGDYQEARKTVNGIDYWVLSRELSRSDMEMQLELMPDVIQHFSQFKKYPFPAFGAVDSRLYGGGALEGYSYATYGTGWLPDEDAHEPAHTWFGGIIPNTYLKNFWNESFAVYGEGHYSREGGPGIRADQRRAFVRTARPSGAYATYSCADSGAAVGNAASSLGYGKGALVLQMLEYELGRKLMVSAIAEWLARYPNGRAATWADFEDAVGPEHKLFFDQWIRRPGWAKLSLADVEKAGTRVTGKAIFEDDPYRIKMEVLVITPGYERSQSVVLNPSGSSASSTFEFTVPADATEVIFDPWGRTLMDRGRVSRRSGRMPMVVDKAHEGWAPSRGRRGEWDGGSRAGLLFVGHPDTMPVMKELCAMAGFQVNGDFLTYRS
jgi:hypothetical protein